FDRPILRFAQITYKINKTQQKNPEHSQRSAGWQESCYSPHGPRSPQAACLLRAWTALSQRASKMGNFPCPPPPPRATAAGSDRQPNLPDDAPFGVNRQASISPSFWRRRGL